jgi:protein TonB
LTALRFPIAVVLATAVAAGLFGFLRALIGARGELEQVQAPGKIEFSRLRRDTEVEERKREKPEKAKPQQAPPPPELSASRASLDPTADAQAIAAIAPTVAAEQALVGGLVGGGGGDRDAVPLVRIEPDYPMQARQRGIEGWVVVQFTISTAGTVKDAVVLASEPGTVFDRAALQAVRKWKYNPKMQNGKPVERAGIKVRLDFEMET